MKCVMSVTAGRSCGSAGTRATLISYNHYTGFIRISGVENLLRRLLIGTVFIGLFGGLAALIDLRIIRWTCRFFHSDDPSWRRLTLEAALAILLGGMLGMVLTFIFHLLMPYHEPLPEVLLTNILIVAVVNLVIASIIEAFLLNRRNLLNRSRAERLEKENLRLRSGCKPCCRNWSRA